MSLSLIIHTDDPNQSGLLDSFDSVRLSVATNFVASSATLAFTHVPVIRSTTDYRPWDIDILSSDLFEFAIGNPGDANIAYTAAASVTVTAGVSATGSITVNTTATAAAFALVPTVDALSYYFTIKRTRATGEQSEYYRARITVKRSVIDPATQVPVTTPGAITTSGLTMTTARLLGRTTAGTGAIEQITVGSGLTLSAGTLTASASSGLTVGTTTISGGTTTRILYDNAGVLGEMTTTGTGTTLALSAGPTFTGTVTAGTFSGAGTSLTGTAASLTAGNATLAATVTLADEAADATTFLVLGNTATGANALKTNALLTFNALTAVLNVTGTLNVSGTITGDILQAGTSVIIGNADTTLARVSAGKVSIAGDTIATLAAANTFTASQTLSSQLILSGRSDATIAADQNDWAPTGATTASEIFVDGGVADRNLTGLSGGVAGRILGITNKGTTNSIIIKNGSASSTAANRFLAPADITLPPNTAIELRYDGTASNWRPWSRSLANTGVTAGSYGSATTSGTFTVDVAGRITAASSTTIALSAASITSGTLAIARGGTNATTFAGGSNGVVYYNGTSLTNTASGTATTVLHGGGAGAPSFAAVNIGSGGDITGTLLPANGGTGITALGTNIAAALGTNIGGTVFISGSLAHTLSGGTAARTLTLPADANFTFARQDAAQTFSGTQTFGAIISTSHTNSGAFTGSTTGDFSGTLTLSSTLSMGGTAITFGALPSGATTSGALATYAAQTYTVTGTNTATAFQAAYHGVPTFTNASAGTVTDLFSEVWAGPAAVAGSQVGTRKHTLGIVDSTSASSAITGGLVVATTLGTAATSVGIGGGNINAGGTITAAGAITGVNLDAGAGGTISGGSRVTMRSAGAGDVTIYRTDAASAWANLHFGSTNSTSSPGWTINLTGTTFSFKATNATVDASITAANITASGALAVTGGLIGGVQALSGAGAVNVTTVSTAFTATGAAQALTLADGTNGQIKTVCMVAAGGAQTGVLTPTTKSGYTTITFNAVGDAVTLEFFTTAGWCVLGSRGVTIA